MSKFNSSSLGTAIAIFILLALANSLTTSSAFADDLGVCGSENWQRFLIRDSWGNASFRAACTNHDACYGTYGEKKESCDEQFYSEMYDACSNAYPSAFHTIQRKACYEIAHKYWYSVHKLGGDAYRQAQVGANPPSAGTVIPGSARELKPYGLVCLVNRTSWDINYTFRWGNGKWQSNSVKAQGSRWHWWEYAPNSQASPNFKISFDADFTSGSNYKQYDLNRNRVSDASCQEGKIYEFKQVANKTIELYDSGN